MADNRLAIRCRACGKSVGLAKRYGNAYYNTSPAETVDAFFEEHFRCASNYPERTDLHFQDHFDLAYETAPKGLPEIGHGYVITEPCPRCAEDARTGVKRVKVSEEFIAELKDGSRPVFVLKIEEEQDGDLLFAVKRAAPFVTREDVDTLRLIATTNAPPSDEQAWLLSDLARRLQDALPPEKPR